MKKFFKILFLLFGFWGVLAAVISLRIGLVENPRDFALSMTALGLALLLISVLIAVEDQGAKTRRLLRKIHGIKKEEDEED